MARLDLYDFVAQCKEDGYTSCEAMYAWEMACFEHDESFNRYETLYALEMAYFEYD